MLVPYADATPCSFKPAQMPKLVRAFALFSFKATNGQTDRQTDRKYRQTGQDRTDRQDRTGQDGQEVNQAIRQHNRCIDWGVKHEN